MKITLIELMILVAIIGILGVETSVQAALMIAFVTIGIIVVALLAGFVRLSIFGVELLREKRQTR